MTLYRVHHVAPVWEVAYYDIEIPGELTDDEIREWITEHIDDYQPWDTSVDATVDGMDAVIEWMLL